MELHQYLSPLPLIAVLRGITPDEVPAIAGVLFDEGFRVLEVPLNSPRPFESIRLLAREFGVISRQERGFSLSERAHELA